MRRNVCPAWTTVTAVMLWLVLGQLLAAPGNSARKKLAPPDSSAYGKTLAEWMTAYWTWNFTGEPASGSVGRVRFMPMPDRTQTGGNWTSSDPAVLEGEQAITVKPGTPIVLPLVALVGEAYADGTTDPFPIVPDTDDHFSLALGGQVFIDGVPVLNREESSAYRAQAAFYHLLPYIEPTGYGAVAAAWFQTVGVVIKPLPVGEHVVRLDSYLILDPLLYGFDLGIVYRNTWTVTVKP